MGALHKINNNKKLNIPKDTEGEAGRGAQKDKLLVRCV